MERYVDLEGTFNFRDMGGYVGRYGRCVAMGKLFRSDELSKLSQEDIHYLENMKLKCIIDYRGEKERVNNEDKEINGANIYYLDPKADVAALASSEANDHFRMENLTADKAKAMMIAQNAQFVLADSSKQAYRKMFDLLLDESNLPLVQHCRGGKDRTGYGAALILLVLGVSKADVMKDYLLTNVYKRKKNEKSLKELYEKTHNEDQVKAMRYLKEANEEFLSKALDTIDEQFNNIENYVHQELHLSDEEIKRLEDIYQER